MCSIKWGLTINVATTKICVFEKRKQVHRLVVYTSNGNVEYVDQFTYLCVIFSHTVNVSLAVKVLQEQALRAYYNILSTFDRVYLDIKTKLSLFDKMVAPIIFMGRKSTQIRKSEIL